ncbi:hypothetical protein H6P81_003016 [Aristolochia fimbriata]|uniref:COMM domain-containing protein n=1 Tax=Aristolochia fimbriata TaxID=158543 RepID=A0AAV7FFW4_ARIFI|nr:hypothetical protein H6P81_003016 [Aristolochia fimbriata]
MDETLHLHLHKLWPLKSEETLEHVLETLWKTRKTGLSSSQKSLVQSLLELPSVEELDPVLACLRSLIRKCTQENLVGDDIQKLFPIDLPLELQSILVLLLQKYQNHWKEEAAKDQSPWQKTRVSYQLKASRPPALTPFAASEMPAAMWPRQADPGNQISHTGVVPTPLVDDANLTCFAPVTLQQGDGPHDNLATIPIMKSMTWTLENQYSTPTNKVAIIILKLQDFSKTPCVETEVKFQLSRDTLEAMLRSLAYISDQLSSNVSDPSGPLLKKQRQ